MDSNLQINKISHFNFSSHRLKPSTTHWLSFFSPLPKGKSWKVIKPLFSAMSSNQSVITDETLLPPLRKDEVSSANSGSNGCNRLSGKGRVFFLDVNPLCYEGSTPSLDSFTYWISIFFSQVSLSDPVVAVVKVEGHEADDVVATLVHQAIQKGYRAVIASPDKDFKQLISEDVQLVMPVTDLNRWSLYTIKHYIAQYNCDPQSDLSLRCILGDEIDGVPGIQHLVPGFGRKTALKLLKKHGSLKNLLSAASVRTVGRQYAQEALTTHADFLRRNYEVLSLKRDVNIQIEDQWLCARDAQNDSVIIASFVDLLGKIRDKRKWQSRSRSKGLEVVTQ